MSVCPTAWSVKTGLPGRETVTGTATEVKEAEESREGREASVADPDRGVEEEVTTREDTTIR